MIRNLRTAFISFPRWNISTVSIFRSCHSEVFLGKERCSENMLQICRRRPMPKCDINKVTKQHICRKRFLSNTYGWLLLYFLSYLRKTGADPWVAWYLGVTKKLELRVSFKSIYECYKFKKITFTALFNVFSEAVIGVVP